MLAALFGAFLTGLVGGVHCIGMCGGFAASTAARHGLRGTGMYTAGRITTYATLGALGGTFGAALGRLQYVGFAVAAVLLVYFAARLAGLVPEKHVHLPWLNRFIAKASRGRGAGGSYFFGAATALIPCGLVYAALALPIATGSPVLGAASMAMFGLGTVPGLAVPAFGARRLSTMGMPLRRAVAVLVLVAGGWAMTHRVPTPAEDDVPDCCQGRFDNLE